MKSKFKNISLKEDLSKKDYLSQRSPKKFNVSAGNRNASNDFRFLEENISIKSSIKMQEMSKKRIVNLEGMEEYWENLKIYSKSVHQLPLKL